MATYLIAGGTCVVAVALVPTVARILSKILPANDKPGTPPCELVAENIKKAK